MGRGSKCRPVRADSGTIFRPPPLSPAGQVWALRLGWLPGLQAIGRVSYGGYVLHLPVIIALRASVFPGALGSAGRVGLFLAAMAASVALATASHRWFEARFLGRRQRALPGRSRPAVAA